MELSIINSLSLSLRKLGEMIKEYTNSFDNTHLINFSDVKSDRKKALKKYNICSAKIANIIAECDTAIASLSKLICEADKACDNEKAQRLYEIFDRYQVFSNSVIRFVKTSEKVFINSSNGMPFRPSELLSASREFQYNIDDLEKYLSLCK